MTALRSSLPCCNSTKTPVRALPRPFSAGFSARTISRHGARRSIITAGSAQLSQTKSDQRVIEKLQKFTIKSLPCNLVKLYIETMLSEQEAWQEVNSSTDTDMLSLVQSPAATAPAASADIAAVKIVSFVVVVMHQLLPRLKLHVQHKPVSPQVLQDLTTLVSMVHELTGQVSNKALNSHLQGHIIYLMMMIGTERNYLADPEQCPRPPKSFGVATWPLEKSNYHKARLSKEDLKFVEARGTLGGRQFQSDARKGVSSAIWEARPAAMNAAGMACFELGSADFISATQSFKAGLAWMREGGIADTADVHDLNMYHLCMDGLLACQALGQDPNPKGYSYEGFKQALHELQGAALRWPLPLNDDLQGLASNVLDAHDKWVQEVQQAYMRMYQDCAAGASFNVAAESFGDIIKMKPNKLQLPGNFCTALGLTTREKWSFFHRTEPLFSSCPTSGVTRKGLFKDNSASAIDASFCLACVIADRMSVFRASHLYFTLSSPPEVADWYLEVLAKVAYTTSCNVSQEVVDHFATSSSEPMSHEPHTSETDFITTKLAGQLAARALGYLADAHPCCSTQGPMSEGVIRLLISVLWRCNYTDTKSGVVDALKLLKGWAGVEDAACAFCCLLISRGLADSGRVPAVTIKRMLDEGLVSGPLTCDAALLALAEESVFDASLAHQVYKCAVVGNAQLASTYVSTASRRGTAGDTLRAYLATHHYQLPVKVVLQVLDAVMTDTAAMLKSFVGDGQGSNQAAASNPWSQLIAAAGSPQLQTHTSRLYADVVFQIFEHCSRLGMQWDAAAWCSLWSMFCCQNNSTGAQGLRQPTAVYEVWSSTKAVQAYQPTSQELSVVQDVCCTQQNWSSAVAVTQWMQPCTVEQRAEAVVRVWTACLPSRSYPDAKVLHRIISMCAASNLQDSLHSGLEVFEVLATDGSLQPQGLSHAVLIHVKLGQLVHASELLQSHSSLARDFSFADQADLFHLAMHSDHEATSLSLAQQLLLLGLHQKHPKATAQGAGLIAAFLKVGELQAAFQVMLLVHQHDRSMRSSCYESMVLAQLQHEQQAANSSEPCQLSLELQSLLEELQQKVPQWPVPWTAETRLLLLRHFRSCGAWEQMLQLFDETKLKPKAVSEDMWQGAIHAACQLGDPIGTYSLWQWKQSHGAAWQVPDGSTYVSLASALAAAGKPASGAAMLMGYEEQGFLQPLTSQACNNFLDTCTAELGTDASASAIAAMKSVVEAMQMGQLPAADAHTYSAAVHCRIEALQHEAPSQTVLVDLYRHLLPEMHQALGRSSSTCRVYAVAMCQFAAAGASAEIVQLLLLMIQNEVVGLDSECSLLIMDELVKDASELMWDWLQDKLGEDFLDAMTAVSGGTTGQLVLLPAKADVPQLRLGTDASGREKLVLADEPCPDWMAHPTWGDQSQSYSV